MDIYTIDFETYYDRDYSLSKMQTDAYCLDPRFELIGMGIAKNDGTPHWFTDALEIDAVLARIDWANAAVRCHNTLFDGFILTRVLGRAPRLWMDTLSQGRMLHPYLVSHSLANLAKHFGLAPKGTEVLNALGKRQADFTRQELADYGRYCCNDVVICRGLGDQFDPGTPPLNAYLIDMTIRMFTEPVLVGDTAEMEKLYAAEVERKETLLLAAATNRDIIMSNDKMAEALTALGVTPPQKLSARTKKMTWAFAKSDKEFTELLEHDDPDVQTLVAARLGVKTTIAESRAKTFVEMSRRGRLPVYLQFWGAKTTGRYSGGNKCNWQNLPARGPTAGLRNALKAPDGHVVVVGDSSNIELRIVMAVAGQLDVLDKLRRGVDLYCDFASTLFGRTITKANKPERMLGKVAMLSLQYGAGAVRFQEMVRNAARLDPALQPITLDRAQEIVDLYRSVHYMVVQLWDYCQKIVLPDIASGGSLINVDVNGWAITCNEGFGRPGEPGVVYHDLKYEEREWTYQMGRMRVRIFGPKVVENLCQHLAMLVVMWQTARINKKIPVKLSVHDEAVTVPLLTDLDATKAYMTECLSLAPPWCRDILPVACEVGSGPSYGEAK